MTQVEFREILMQNFAKVEKYIIENFTDVLPRNEVFTIEDNAFIWVKFVVTTDGYAILARGGHDNDNAPSKFIICGEVREQSIGSLAKCYDIRSAMGEDFLLQKTCIYPFNDEEIEKFLDRWLDIKFALLQRVRKFNELKYFEV